MNLVPLTRFEWEQTVREVAMPPTAKLVAFELATYADRKGENIRPGRKRLARECCISVRTVERQLAWLEDHGLLLMTFNGALAGRRAMASVYRLVIAEDLPDRVAFVHASPDTHDEGSAEGSAAEPPTPVTEVPAEPPTPVTGSTDTTAGSNDTGDAEQPTPVSPHQYIDQNNHQISSSTGPLQRALATAGLSQDLKREVDDSDKHAGPNGPDGFAPRTLGAPDEPIY